MTPYLIAAAIVVWWTALDDIRERNLVHGWLQPDKHGRGGWWFAANRWKAAYRDPDGPYTRSNWRWFIWIGGGGFIDLWHTCKTLQLLSLYAAVCLATGTPLWAIPLLWGLHGAVHELLYNGLFKRWP